MVWSGGMLGERVYGLVVFVGHFDSETIDGLLDQHDRRGLVFRVMLSPFFHACLHMRPYMVTCWVVMRTECVGMTLTTSHGRNCLLRELGAIGTHATDRIRGPVGFGGTGSARCRLS